MTNQDYNNLKEKNLDKYFQLSADYHAIRSTLTREQKKAARKAIAEALK
jgi:molecular chaperone GrpE (heat shock protein)